MALHNAAFLTLYVQAAIGRAIATNTSAFLRVADGAQVMRVGIIPVDACSEDRSIQVQIVGAALKLSVRYRKCA